MIRHPKVIERPIVVTGKGARIGRPPENILEII
jgi:arsenate reductase